MRLYNGFSGLLLIDGDIVFSRAKFNVFDIARTRFTKNLDLEDVEIATQLRFETVSFDGDVHLEGATFGKPDDRMVGQNFIIDDVTFNKALYWPSVNFFKPYDWWNFWADNDPRFTQDTTEDPNGSAVRERRLWSELRRAFDIAGDLTLKNYAEYRERYLLERGEDERTRIISTFSRLYWGYSLRPLRIMCRFAILIVLFAGAYGTQLSKLGSDYTVFRRFILRAKYALLFSWRTALEIKFGVEHSRTHRISLITLVETIAGKVIVATFACSLAQTSPLLSDLVKKLLPGM